MTKIVTILILSLVVSTAQIIASQSAQPHGDYLATIDRPIYLSTTGVNVDPLLQNISIQDHTLFSSLSKADLRLTYYGTFNARPQSDADFFSYTMDGASLYHSSDLAAFFSSNGAYAPSAFKSVAILKYTDSESINICFSDYDDMNNYYYKSELLTVCVPYDETARR